MQEGGATSSTDVTEQVTDSTEVHKTAKESVSVEQEQLLRAAEPDQCILNVKTQRQRYTVEFAHSLLGVNGEAADDLHRRRQDSDPEDASFDRTDVAAVTEPKEVTLYTVRVGCERLEMWRFGVRSLKCQNETADITSLNTVDRTRRVKTIPRNKTRYSHDSLGRSEDNETDLGTKYGTRPHREMYDEEGNDDCGSLGWRTVVSGFGHQRDLWGGADRGSQLDDRCCVAHHSWSGIASLCVCCIRSAPTNWKCTFDRKELEFERKTNGMILRSMREHRPREREDMESLMVFQRLVVAADGDIEYAVLST